MSHLLNPDNLNSCQMETEETIVSLDDVLGSHAMRSGESRAAKPLTPAVIIGMVMEIATDGTPLVNFPGNQLDRPLPARSAGTMDARAIGAEVALLFEQGDPSKPLVIGVIQQSPSARHAGEATKPLPKNIETSVDGERLVITADKEIELRCGKASITLTKAGKVIIRGEFVLSRSAGVNRIKGGSVQIN
jgi:hypothetical protein